MSRNARSWATGAVLRGWRLSYRSVLLGAAGIGTGAALGLPWSSFSRADLERPRRPKGLDLLLLPGEGIRAASWSPTDDSDSSERDGTGVEGF